MKYSIIFYFLQIAAARNTAELTFDGEPSQEILDQIFAEHDILVSGFSGW